ncbi:Retrovirus Polyprotein, partial [Phytophthora palmivora]
MVLDAMSGSTTYSAIDLMDGFYQILMREKDVPLTAVSTPSGMLWEWLVMRQGLKNAPATFNRIVSNLLCPFRDFAPSYFDDIFIHSRAEGGMTEVEVHLIHLRQVFEVMRENKLYANLKNCIFCAPEIPVLGSYVSKEGVRADPEKVETICAWPAPQNQKQLRQWLGLATYLHHYSKNFAATVLKIVSIFDKELLAMRYALIKFRVYLLGEQTFAVYTDHASLRTATKSPHLSQRMARWLSLFSEYNVVVHYKPGKTNILALPRRPDYIQSGRHGVGDEDDDECAACTAEDVTAVEITATSPLRNLISSAYEVDETCSEMIKYLRDPSDTARRRLS